MESFFLDFVLVRFVHAVDHLLVDVFLLLLFLLLELEVDVVEVGVDFLCFLGIEMGEVVEDGFEVVLGLGVALLLELALGDDSVG